MENSISQEKNEEINLLNIIVLVDQCLNYCKFLFFIRFIVQTHNGLLMLNILFSSI